jgi:hypothetical protein
MLDRKKPSQEKEVKKPGRKTDNIVGVKTM